MTIGGLTWDATSKRYYYTGIDGVALFVDNGSGWYGAPIAWNGVTALNESPSGAESNKIYADNIEYLNLLSKEEFGATLECYQVPEAFDPCDGIYSPTAVGVAAGAFKIHGQGRKSFCLVYRVQKGSDTVEAGGKVEGNTKGAGYVYHIIYGCKAAPSSRDFGTVNDSPEAISYSYEITCTALTDSNKMPTVGGKPGLAAVAHLEIDGTTLTTSQESALIAALYGSVGTPLTEAPTPADIAEACGYTDTISNG